MFPPATQNAILLPHLSRTAKSIVSAAVSFNALFADQPDAQLAALPTSGCAITPDVDAVPQPATSDVPRGTGGQFTLGQNFPNPYVDQTTIPFTLTRPADVQLGVFDAQGRKVAGVLRRNLQAGEQHIGLNLHGLGLPAGDYSYQLQVFNSRGVYHQFRNMTLI